MFLLVSVLDVEPLLYLAELVNELGLALSHDVAQASNRQAAPLRGSLHRVEQGVQERLKGLAQGAGNRRPHVRQAPLSPLEQASDDYLVDVAVFGERGDAGHPRVDLLVGE